MAREAVPARFRPFAWMRDATATEGMTGYEMAVVTALVLMQRNGKIEAAAAETIAAKAHVPLRTAERAVARLRKAGLIQVVKRYGRKGRLANGYRLVETGADATRQRAGAGPVPAHGADKCPHTVRGGVPAHGAERTRSYPHKRALSPTLRYAEAYARSQQAREEGRADPSAA